MAAQLSYESCAAIGWKACSSKMSLLIGFGAVVKDQFQKNPVLLGSELFPSHPVAMYCYHCKN